MRIATDHQLDKTNHIGYTLEPSAVASDQGDAAGGTGWRCDRPPERPACRASGGTSPLLSSTKPAPACHPRATRGPADNQASAPTGIASRPRSKGPGPIGPRASSDGEDEGPRGMRTPHTSACHEARGHAGRFSRQPRERCVRKSYSRASTRRSSPLPSFTGEGWVSVFFYVRRSQGLYRRRTRRTR